MGPYCAAIDWGTSSFRIWLMSDDGTPLAERRSNEGMTLAAKAGFENVMERHLQDLHAPADLPVIICGMAGSRQGWREARYLTVPAKLDDVLARAVRVDGSQRDIRILPGLAQRDAERPDVMRGEETQLLGEFARDGASGLACMPGTHSKWVRIKSGHVTEFSTYMTGELFGLIARQSILRHAVGDADSCDPQSDAFLQAVADARDHPASVSRLLFSIRAGQLLNARDAASNYEQLSGLLIGWEIAAARTEFGADTHIHLIASGKLSGLYNAAFRSLGMKVSTIDADQSVVKGLMAGARLYWPISDHHSEFGQIKA